MTESDLIIENIINQIECHPLNEMAQWRQDKDFLTGWITPAEANTFIRDAITSGEYAKGEIKKSSMRWADPSDHSKGYLCRVVLAGEKASPKREYSQRTIKRRALKGLDSKSKSLAVDPNILFAISSFYDEYDKWGSFEDEWGFEDWEWRPDNLEKVKSIIKRTTRPIRYKETMKKKSECSPEFACNFIDRADELNKNVDIIGYTDEIIIFNCLYGEASHL